VSEQATMARAPARARRLVERRWLRPLLLIAGPALLILVGLYLYVTGGRYISTDNAYVHADATTISTDVPGRVAEVAVHEHQLVKAGEVLFRLDDAPYRYALDKASAQLASTRLDVDALRASYFQKQTDVRAAEQNLDFFTRELERQRQLLASHFTSQVNFDQALHNRDTAQQALDGAHQALASALATLGGDPALPTGQHPRVLAAKAARDQAAYDLDRTTVTAASDGTVAQVDKLQKGQYVTAGTPLFMLIGTQVWVDANFKETELTHMQPGQSATVDVDTYPDCAFTGSVASISPGTGAEFSVLPAQNATGNWVKVVQRIPVRVAVDTNSCARPLRAGMSATVAVDTQHRRAVAAIVDSALARGTK
jgi:membrane fusion protein (multidrug efflux system)